MTVGSRALLSLVAGVGMSVLSPAGAAALQAPPTPPVDSADIRVRARLERLNRGLGVDSTLIRLDSVVGARRAGPAPQPADSFMARLMELGGYSVTNYDGAGAHFETGVAKLQLMGDGGERPASLTRPDMRLTAVDTIIMDDTRNLVWTRGATVTERPGEEPVNSENIVYDLDQDRGSAFGARTRFNQGAEWILFGDLPGVYPDLVYGTHVTFTSCQEIVPHYHFAAKETKVVGGGWLLARSVTLNFGGVPVFWLPFIFQNVESERSSGILFPRFGVNDIVRSSRGQTRRLSNVGFYWAANDYSDATVALDWWSDNFLSLTGNVRYNVLRKFLNGSASYRQFWRSDGGRELSFDTRHSWEVSERMSVRGSARFSSSAQFVRQNSFDPREVTGSINSEGGLNRRFDWGSLSVNANRRQFLSDDRVEMTLPSANLSLKTITLFRAPPSGARFYNNLTWSGSANATRTTSDRKDQDLSAGQAFSLSLADQRNTNASFSSSFNLGSLGWSQSVNLTEGLQRDVPHSAAFPDDSLAAEPQALSDISAATVNWSTALSYQQRLIRSSSTTLTPSLSISGQAKRDDLNPEARSFVSGPKRVAFGARLRSDVYGFFGGFGPFEAVRHKISPSFTYSYAPAVDPTDLQERVFGATETDATNVLTIGFNQTFEAKRRAPSEAAPAADVPESVAPVEAQPVEAAAQATDSLAAQPDSTAVGADDGPRRQQESPIVNLLSLQTNAVTYDFTRASKDENRFLDGFQTTRLTNAITSDFLPGLSIRMAHELFDTNDEGERTLSPFLSTFNTGFSVTNRSGIVRAVGRLLGMGGEPGVGPAPVEEEEEEEDIFSRDLNAIGVTDESSIVPGRAPARADPNRRPRGSMGGWQAQVGYSLSRFRDESRESNQLADVSLRFRPTENWSATWRTSYDVVEGRFNDHVVRLTRELHRWEANFDFLQTATGNWTFRFNVSLRDNQDLKFDYEQQNNDRERPF